MCAKALTVVVFFVALLGLGFCGTASADITATQDSSAFQYKMNMTALPDAQDWTATESPTSSTRATLE